MSQVKTINNNCELEVQNFGTHIVKMPYGRVDGKATAFPLDSIVGTRYDEVTEQQTAYEGCKQSLGNLILFAQEN